jgi:hypothetical protein
MSRAARSVFTSVLALCVASLAWGDTDDLSPRAPEGVRTIGYVPGPDPALDAAVLEGLREGLAASVRAGGRPVVLRVGRRSNVWRGAAPEAVRLVCGEGAGVLVSAPERRVAHLLAQVGTRTQVPVVSTSAVPTIRATGSTWVHAVVTSGDDAIDATEARRRGRLAAAEALARLPSLR